MGERPKIFGVPIDPIGNDEALDRIFAAVEAKARFRVAFVNADCLNQAMRDASYRLILEDADLVLPDGTGVRWAGRILHHLSLENVNGTDLFPLLCERAMREGRSLFLLGGRPGVAAEAAQMMQSRLAGLKVVGTHHGYFDRDEEPALLEAIRHAAPDLLLVALGVPRQEAWIVRCHEALEVPVCLGVGGLFDFFSGRVRRAPKLVRRLGQEWAWRLLMEPRRLWRRYLVGNAVFLLHLRREVRARRAGRTSARGRS